MTTVADYRVLRDGNFSLEANAEETIQFTVENNFVAGTNFAKPIIAFRFDPSSNANNLRYEVDINGSRVTSLTNIDSSLRRHSWEAFSGELINTNGNNSVQFRVENGTGSIGFSDVILWYQRDI